ncbi:MAG: DUF3810 domain-containing protein [Oscillospiraceae bacterium]
MIKWCAVTAPPLLALAVFYIFSSSRSFANGAVKYFSRPVKDFLGTVFSYVPFSVMELMYVALGVFVIVFIVCSVIKIKRSGKRLLTLLKRTAVLLLVVIYIFTAYLWLLGIDYRSDSFEDKSGISPDGVTTDQLYAVTEYFLTSALALSDTVERDAEGHFSEDMDSYFAASADIYGAITEEFPFLEGSSRTPKKMLLFSKLSSYMGFTGVYFPFTGESNINIDPPGCLIPFTIAHELAHQRGIYAEQEANFLGIAACLSSGNAVYTYSGFLSGTIYLMNALYKADKELWSGLRSQITGSMLIDWQDNNSYWSTMESVITTASETVYDGYLKANGQELGIKSYGACVDLLVAYYYGLAA